jgi:hypothetical protein
MKRIRPGALAILLAVLAPVALAQSEAPESEAPESDAAEEAQVSYFRQAIAEKSDELMRLYGGSWWLLARPKLAVLSDVVVIKLDDERQGTAFIGGEEIPVEHVRGEFTPAVGRLSTIAESIGTGAVIALADESRWHIPKYDQSRSADWSRDDPIVITESQHYLINLRTGEKIWARRGD